MEQPFTQAQPGDEAKRQVGDSLGSILDQQLQDAISRRATGIRGQQQVQEFAPTVAKNVEATRDLSQRVEGEAPSALIGSAAQLGQAYVTASQQASEAASSKDILSILGLLQNEQQRQLDNRLKAIDSGFKVNEDGLLEPLSDEEKMSRGLVGEEAVAEVIRQGGSDLIQKGGTKDERYAIAEGILKSGGISEYKKQIPLIELINDKEETDIQTQTDLLQLIDQGINLFSGQKTKLGTGPLAALIPGFAAGETTRNLRRSVENVKSQYAKILSGATISDNEMKRLEQFLPSSNKTEQQNLEDLKKLSRDIQINQLIFEKGKREGLTANQAYNKYGKEVFNQFGVGENQSTQEGEWK